MSKHVQNLALILVGGFIFALGINLFALPAELSEGGVIGITILLYYYFGWSPGITNFLINLALMVAGYKLLDKRTIVYTIFGIISASIFLFLTQNITHKFSDDTLLIAIFAGLLVGIGLGLVFLSGGTTGGSAIIARIINKYFGVSLGQAMLAVDILVIGVSYFKIGPEKTLYTLIAVYLGARVVDYIIEGFNTKKAITIISENSIEIAARINRQLIRGATLYNARGAYTRKEKEVVYTIISKQQLLELKRLVNDCDPNAFVVVHDVHEVMGKWGIGTTTK
ncbi:YitT family protein [Solitalea lacus]|uniref:YitT family protein n=1 Tax=Solitalea lacus TaxID=2911172 RepID=UPI001EDBB78B|nr:YitT family protein [Solitalea lacus]UKJ08980.1 YitT family protein [Solitalea lacus]